MKNPFADPPKTPAKATAKAAASAERTRRDASHAPAGGGDQAGRLRSLIAPQTPAAPSTKSPKIAVIGAKGGVGATTITWRLAEALATEGSPLAVDGHLWQPDLARVAGLAMAEGATLPEVLSGAATAADAVRVGDGPALLPGSWADTPGAGAGDFGVSFSTPVAGELAARFDTILVDGGPARTPWVGSLCKAADLVLLVTTPGELALLGAYSLIKLATSAAKWAPPIRLIINRCENEAHGRNTHARIRDACREHLGASVSLAGWLPPDPRLAARNEPPIPLMRPIVRRVRETLRQNEATAAAKAA